MCCGRLFIPEGRYMGMSSTEDKIREIAREVSKATEPVIKEAKKAAEPIIRDVKEATRPYTQKSEPYIKKAEPYIKDIKEKAEPYLKDIKEKAEPVYSEVKTKAEPYIKDIKEKAEPYITKAKEKTAPATKVVKETSQKAAKAAKEAGQDLSAKTAKFTCKEEVFVQYSNHEIKTSDIIERAKKDYINKGNKATSIKEIQVYIKPSDNAAYYVVNHTDTGKVEF